jgi:hypothetical protein
VLYASKARIWRVSFAVAHTTAWLEDEHAGSVSRSRGSGLVKETGRPGPSRLSALATV